MDNTLVLQIVGSRLDDLSALKSRLKAVLGDEPSINLRLEITLGADQIVVTIDDDQVVVRDERVNRVLAQGDWGLARAAIKGMEPDPTG